MGYKNQVFHIVALIFAASLLVWSCDSGIFSSDTDKDKLPGVFPLEVGNAWVYERNNFNNGETSYDTLYIPGKYQGHFKYTWDPANYYSIINNEEQYLIFYGGFNGDSLVFEEPPVIWSFYPDKKGWVEFDDFSEFYDVYADSIYIDIIKDYPVLDRTENVYKETWYYYYGKTQIIYHSNSGFIKIIGMNLSDTVRTTTLVERLTDFYPPDTTSVLNSSVGMQLQRYPIKFE